MTRAEAQRRREKYNFVGGNEGRNLRVITNGANQT
jgi:hypothetical protein